MLRAVGIPKNKKLFGLKIANLRSFELQSKISHPHKKNVKKSIRLEIDKTKLIDKMINIFDLLCSSFELLMKKEVLILLISLLLPVFPVR